MTVWLNGEYHTEPSATLPAFAAGALLGWGVFTTIGVWHRRAFALPLHLARLRRDAAALDIPLEFDDKILAEALENIIGHNGVSQGIARITAWRRGDGRWNRETGGDVSIMALPPVPNAPYPGSLRLALSPFRLDARRPLAGVKSTSYAEYQRIWLEVRARGYDEAVVLNSDGAICEAARANVFWARDGALWTPSLECGPLPGIGREIVLDWAAQDGITVHQGAFEVAELAAADEVFLLSAATGPRTMQSFHDGQDHVYQWPGTITRQLQAYWQAAV